MIKEKKREEKNSEYQLYGNGTNRYCWNDREIVILFPFFIQFFFALLSNLGFASFLYPFHSFGDLEFEVNAVWLSFSLSLFLNVLKQF